MSDYKFELVGGRSEGKTKLAMLLTLRSDKANGFIFAFVGRKERSNGMPLYCFGFDFRSHDGLFEQIVGAVHAARDMYVRQGG